MATLTPYSSPVATPKLGVPQGERPDFDILKPLRRWLDRLPVDNPRRARWICRLIPSQCPLERDVELFGRTVHIPALCKLNPVYDELMGLRYRALNYLADVCDEDITPYIR